MQRFALGFDGSDILGDRLVEQGAPRRVHLLRESRTLHTAQPRNLRGELGDVGVTLGDGVLVASDHEVARGNGLFAISNNLHLLDD